jgi:hypothetical protein
LYNIIENRKIMRYNIQELSININKKKNKRSNYEQY